MTLIFLLIAVLVFLPPKWDPAIRVKEWQIRQGWHSESKGNNNG